MAVAGQDCLIYLTSDEQHAITPADLADRTANLVRSIHASARLGGLIVAGGDTSSAVVRTLAPNWLDYAGELCAGVPILQAQVQGADLLMALKGGQMGGVDFFVRAALALRGR
ncbi:nucleotide-binding domain containing protein [Frigidibacter mobilis]|uniref:Four-carbon acid sugar kinase nucleotide binding domain-containing protein n=1 Tax=Frigidibacter mobilis TaxID=1335048 RepID=A0A159Z8L3_9RHOB|nr:nucleotide-binding domain containing protein [Frigidibacter mobilis]AMY71000.1 hypothetical protein AKL17_3778 [Frigidibacter mobilis]